MFWTEARQFSRTIGFRLNLWYGALFAAGTLLLFVLAFYLLSAAVDRKDREMVETRLNICAAIYQIHGLERLREWVEMAHEARQQSAFFVRVNDPEGRLLLLHVPRHWHEEDVQLVSRAQPVTTRSWKRLARDEALDVSIASVRLPDGSLMQVARRTSSRGTLMRDFQKIALLVLGPAIFLGLAIGAFVARGITRPLRQLAEAVREILDTRKLEVRVPTRPQNDELQDLIILFNRMIAQNEQHLRSLKETLDNVAHDIRTPLTRMRASAETALQENELSERCAAALQECIAEADYIQTMIQTLLEIARAEGGVLRPKLERVDVADLVEHAVGLFEHVAEEKRIALHIAAERDCYATVDPVRMRRVFANLLDNAIHYTPATGSIHVEVRCEREEVMVRIRDTGTGIGEEDLPRIWDRLYRGDQGRSHFGLGLGLSLVKAIVELNGGRVGVQSKLGRGSEFIVSLPETSVSSGGNGAAAAASRTRRLVGSGST